MSQWVDPLPSIFPAGSLSLLSGASGVGKTAFIAGLAKLFRDGGNIYAHRVNQVPVGYITADRSWTDSCQWFNAVGYPNVRQYSIVDDRKFELHKLGKRADGTEALKEAIGRLEFARPAVLIVDPIALFLGGNLLDYHTVAISCIKLSRVALDTGHTIIGICHTSKQKADQGERYLRVQDRISGTNALLGYTGTQLNLSGPDETGREDGLLQLYVNPHHAKAETWYLERQDNGLLRFVVAPAAADEAVGPPADAKSRPLTADAWTVHGVLNDPPDPTTFSDVLARVSDQGLQPRTLLRRLQALQAHGHVSQPRKGLWLKVVQPDQPAPADGAVQADSRPDDPDVH